MDMMKMTALATSILLAPALPVSTAFAQSTPHTPAAAASGDSAAASVETGAALASTGVTVTAGTVVLLGGVIAGSVTGDPELIDMTENLSEAIMQSTFETGYGLEISETTIIADPPPNIPYVTPANP